MHYIVKKLTRERSIRFHTTQSTAYELLLEEDGVEAQLRVGTRNVLIADCEHHEKNIFPKFSETFPDYWEHFVRREASTNGLSMKNQAGNISVLYRAGDDEMNEYVEIKIDDSSAQYAQNQWLNQQVQDRKGEDDRLFRCTNAFEDPHSCDIQMLFCCLTRTMKRSRELFYLFPFSARFPASRGLRGQCPSFSITHSNNYCRME